MIVGLSLIAVATIHPQELKENLTGEKQKLAAAEKDLAQKNQEVLTKIYFSVNSSFNPDGTSQSPERGGCGHHQGVEVSGSRAGGDTEGKLSSLNTVAVARV